MTLGGSGSSKHFQIWKYLHFSMKNGYKIDQKIGKVVSIVRECFQGPEYMSKKGNLDVSDERLSEKSEKNWDGTYNRCIIGHCFQGSCQGPVHIPQKENIT